MINNTWVTSTGQSTQSSWRDVSVHHSNSAISQTQQTQNDQGIQVAFPVQGPATELGTVSIHNGKGPGKRAGYTAESGKNKNNNKKRGLQQERKSLVNVSETQFVW